MAATILTPDSRLCLAALPTLISLAHTTGGAVALPSNRTSALATVVVPAGALLPASSICSGHQSLPRMRWAASLRSCSSSRCLHSSQIPWVS